MNPITWINAYLQSRQISRQFRINSKVKIQYQYMKHKLQPTYYNTAWNMFDLAMAIAGAWVTGYDSLVQGPFIDIVKFLTNNHTTRLVMSLRNVTQLPLPAAHVAGLCLIYFHVSYCCKTDFWMGMLFVVTEKTLVVASPPAFTASTSVNSASFVTASFVHFMLMMELNYSE